MLQTHKNLAGGYKFPVEKAGYQIDPYTEIAIAGSGYGPLAIGFQRIAKNLLGGYEDYLVIEDRIADTLVELYENSFDCIPCRPRASNVELLHCR